MHPRPALRLHGPELREAPRRHAASSGRATTRRPTAPSGSTPTSCSRPFPELCEDYGHDVVTGATFTEADFRALGADGRAILKAAEWTPPHEWAGGEYPFTLTTGRTVYHFHTRTKTGRAPELQAAAPDAVGRAVPSRRRAARDRRGRHGARLLAARRRSSCPRGSAARARASSSSPSTTATGTSSDGAGPDGQPRAANELTITLWDPVSKQPRFKTAAVKVERA